MRPSCSSSIPIQAVARPSGASCRGGPTAAGPEDPAPAAGRTPSELPDSFAATGDPWVNLDVSGTLYRTRASTLCQVPSTLQCAVQRQGPWQPADLTEPLAIDVDGETFAHVLDFLRYLRLNKGLQTSTLSRIIWVARRLGMDALETEAKHIYPLRAEKTAAKARLDDHAPYWVFFRECWIRGGPLDRQALAHKTTKATRGRLNELGLRHSEKMALRALNGKDGATWAFGLVDFVGFLTDGGCCGEATREFATLAKWIQHTAPNAPVLARLLAQLRQHNAQLLPEHTYRAKCLRLLTAH